MMHFYTCKYGLILANSVDPDKSASISSGSALFVKLTKYP